MDYTIKNLIDNGFNLVRISDILEMLGYGEYTMYNDVMFGNIRATVDEFSTSKPPKMRKYHTVYTLKDLLKLRGYDFTDDEIEIIYDKMFFIKSSNN